MERRRFILRPYFRYQYGLLLRRNNGYDLSVPLSRAFTVCANVLLQGKALVCAGPLDNRVLLKELAKLIRFLAKYGFKKIAANIPFGEGRSFLRPRFWNGGFMNSRQPF